MHSLRLMINVSTTSFKRVPKPTCQLVITTRKKAKNSVLKLITTSRMTV